MTPAEQVRRTVLAIAGIESDLHHASVDLGAYIMRIHRNDGNDLPEWESYDVRLDDQRRDGVIVPVATALKELRSTAPRGLPGGLVAHVFLSATVQLSPDAETALLFLGRVPATSLDADSVHVGRVAVAAVGQRNPITMALRRNGRGINEVVAPSRIRIQGITNIDQHVLRIHRQSLADARSGNG